MSWLKHIIIDIVATLVIVIVVFYETALLEYVLYIYTGLMVLARLFSLYSRDFRSVTRLKLTTPPVWIHHLLYFLNVVVLFYGAFYVTGVAWGLIWAIAFYVHTQIPTQ